MKKVLIVAVCIALVLTLAFTLGALGKKPDKPGKPEYVNYDVTLTGDVSGDIPCTGKHGVSTYTKPVRLYLESVFSPEIEGCCLGALGGDEPYGVYFELWEHRRTIIMGYWFWYPDNTGKMEKLMLEVEGEVPPDWLSLEGFTVYFTEAPARITRTGNRVVWPENGDYGTVTIVVTCTPSL